MMPITFYTETRGIQHSPRAEDAYKPMQRRTIDRIRKEMMPLGDTELVRHMYDHPFEGSSPRVPVASSPCLEDPNKVDGSETSPTNIDSDWTVNDAENQAMQENSDGTISIAGSEGSATAGNDVIEEPASNLMMMQDKDQREQAADILLHLQNKSLENDQGPVNHKSTEIHGGEKASIKRVEEKDPHNEMTWNMLKNVRQGTLRSGKQYD